ncbi:MAG TPA: hypothetical protein VH478_05540 [Trebonia sp.]|jgi:hypothetical protein|nr:hypothetical protein [Trebonia sp.]
MGFAAFTARRIRDDLPPDLAAALDAWVAALHAQVPGRIPPRPAAPALAGRPPAPSPPVGLNATSERSPANHGARLVHPCE